MATFLDEVRGLYKNAKLAEYVERQKYYQERVEPVLQEVLKEIRVAATEGRDHIHFSTTDCGGLTAHLIAEKVAMEYGLRAMVVTDEIYIAGWGNQEKEV